MQPIPWPRCENKLSKRRFEFLRAAVVDDAMEPLDG